MKCFVKKYKFTFVVVVTSILILVQGIFRQFPNVDEVAHLPAGVSPWLFSRFDLYRTSPPLVHIVTGLSPTTQRVPFDWKLFSDKPGLKPEFAIGIRHLEKSKLGLVNDFIVARICCLFFFLFFVAATLFLTRDVFCDSASRNILCVLCCTCPNILAGAQTIIPDVGGVAMGVFACLAFWNYFRRPCMKSTFLAGFALGLALVSKLTWITAVVSLPLTVLLCSMIFKNPHRIVKRLFHLAAALAIALFTLNVFYLFEGSATPLAEYEFCSDALGGTGESATLFGNRFRGKSIGSLPVPLPKNYVLGIDALRFKVEKKKWSFLLGEWRFGSWLHYYVFTTLFKTPEPTMLATLVGAGVLLEGIRRKIVSSDVIAMFLFLTIPAAFCFACVSLQGGFNHHHRYVLMIYPPMFALVTYVASPVGVKLLSFRLPFLGHEKRSFAVPLVVTLVTLSVTSSLNVHPYYTSYFNTLSGGPSNGWKLLGSSNIDWGQDILEVDRWLKSNQDKRPLVMDIDYFGMNGELFDVPTQLPPRLRKDASFDEVRKTIRATQWWIISTKRLYNLPEMAGIEYLQQIEPVTRIAHAYHVYRIDPLPRNELERHSDFVPPE
jgi:hypothetical protein